MDKIIQIQAGSVEKALTELLNAVGKEIVMKRN